MAGRSARTVRAVSGQAGWYPDPLGRYDLRYHNGTTWTADVAVDGRRAVDPAGVSPSPVPGWGPAPPQPRNGSAVASMVCGIVAAALGWIPFVAFAMVALAIVAIALGAHGRRRARELGGSGSSQAIAGIWTGAAGLVLAGLGIALTFLFNAAYDRYEHPADHDVEVRRCGRDVEVALTNLDDDDADFALLVTIDRAGGGDEERRLELDDVEPGETRIGSLQPVAGDGAARCLVRVDGPLPWGVDPEDFES